ncbi:MAG: hypothetical protein R3D00_02820 [Bacteroidia bacterium]
MIDHSTPKSLMRVINHQGKNFYRFFCYCQIAMLLYLPAYLQAQKSIADSAVSMAFLQVGYQGMITGNDLTDRFGFSSQLGMDVGYKFRKGLYLSTGLRVFFTDAVREDKLLNNLIVPGGFLIADNGTLTGIRIFGTGWVVPLSVGKVFSLNPKHNSNSGFYAEVGGQFFQHKISLFPTDEKVKAITGDYKKGYDRLTNGIGIREAVGYRYFANNGFLNFSIGFEFSQNFTQSRRSINFDTGEMDTRKRMDLLSGFSVGWIFPLYERAPDKVYYF